MERSFHTNMDTSPPLMEPCMTLAMPASFIPQVEISFLRFTHIILSTTFGISPTRWLAILQKPSIITSTFQLNKQKTRFQTFGGKRVFFSLFVYNSHNECIARA